MKGTKTRTVNTLGMFDLFKGIGMATVILAHTTESYSLSLEGGISVFGFVLFIYREALMSAFYIASGYGFRKRSLGKCVRQQLKGILPPGIPAPQQKLDGHKGRVDHKGHIAEVEPGHLADRIANGNQRGHPQRGLGIQGDAYGQQHHTEEIVKDTKEFVHGIIAFFPMELHPTANRG